MRMLTVFFDPRLLALISLGAFCACSENASMGGTGAPAPEGETEGGDGMGAAGAPAVPSTGGSSAGAGNSEDGTPAVQGRAGSEGEGPGASGIPGSMTPPCEVGAPACGTVPAFPGADGAGGYVTGGRGGDVYHVTRLDTDSSDMTPGTLRFGLSNLTAPRTIVFDVSGVFSLGRTAVAGWDDNGNGWDTASRLNIPSNVTIAGQTAPGPVIITGGVVKAGGDNFILRNVTIAPGYGSRGFDEPEQPPVADDFPDSYVFDAIDVTGNDLIIDHVTTVYATDETISMNETVDNATVQYSSISQGQNYPQADAEATGVRYTGHALGSLLQAGSNANVSIHHNLYAHQKGRLPRVGTEADALTVPGVGAYNDLRNNVFFNWFGTAGTGASGQPSQNNFIANFYLGGPGGDDASGGASTVIVTAAGGSRFFDGSDPINTRVHHAGNLKDMNVDGDALDGTPLVDLDITGSRLEAAPFTETRYDGVTDAADVAFQRVLDYSGSMWWSRAPLDQRLVSDVRAGTGKIVAWADNPFDASEAEGVEWRALINTASTARPPEFDTDQDGMPDAWESEHALDPSVPDNNGDLDADGYTNLEEYINEIAAWPAPSPAIFLGSRSQRYAQIQNWRLAQRVAAPSAGQSAWQPSRFDVAQISMATAVVDAMGQHAGALDVSSTAGTATLDVVAGSLVVDGTLAVGSSASWQRSARELGAGQVNQSGGWLNARAAIVLGGPPGAIGEYNLTGGVLSTRRLMSAGSGTLNFSGGTLHADVVEFDLVNDGGVLWPGSAVLTSRSRSAGHLEVRGALTLRSGVLRVALTEAFSDTLDIAGDVELGGVLDVQPIAGFSPRAGDSWTILTAHGKIGGSFERVPAGYRVDVLGPRVRLSYGSAEQGPGAAPQLARNP